MHSRVHAKLLDKYFGYKIPKIEVKLLQKYRAYDQDNDASSKKQHYEGTQAWIGLHPQALLTPYCDIFDALKEIDILEDGHVVDIGAGYGRVGIVLSSLFPRAKFTGYEIVRQRQVEANRVFDKLGLDNAYMSLCDVLDEDFDLPRASAYFIYDFSEQEDIYYILKTLKQRVGDYEFFLITKGDRVEHLLKTKFSSTWSFQYKTSQDGLKVYCA